MKKKTLVSWSSGKDSAWTLYTLQKQKDIEVVGLFSTINVKFQRVAMHAVSVELLNQQAKCIDLPIQLIPIPYPCSNSTYHLIMKKFVRNAKQKHIECMAFGDLFLEDVKTYREKALRGTGIDPIFPLWGTSTKRLSREIVKRGLKAKITCIDPKFLTPDFAGRDYDASFLEALPDHVDPCGENGEFHSFVYDGPMFVTPLDIVAGKVVNRDGFIFVDVLPRSRRER